MLLLVLFNDGSHLLLSLRGKFLNEYLGLRNELLFGVHRVIQFLLRIGNLSFQVLFEMWVVLKHSEFHDAEQDIQLVDEVEQLHVLHADAFKLEYHLLRHLPLCLARFVT